MLSASVATCKCWSVGCRSDLLYLFSILLSSFQAAKEVLYWHATLRWLPGKLARGILRTSSTV